MLIPSREPWRFQPQYPARLDRIANDPRGVVFLPSAIVNAVNQKLMPIAGNGISVASGIHGVAAKFTGSGTGRIDTSITDFSQFSVIMLATFSGGGGGALGRPVSTFNGTGGNDSYYSGTALHVQTHWTGTGDYSVQLASGTTTGVAFSFDASVISGRPNIWVNGAKPAMTNHSIQSGSRIAGGTTFSVGGRPDVTTRQFNGSIFLAALLPVLFADDELRKLSLNPFNLFSDRVEANFFPDSGGITMPVLSAPSFAGRVPSVTITH